MVARERGWVPPWTTQRSAPHVAPSSAGAKPVSKMRMNLDIPLAMRVLPLAPSEEKMVRDAHGCLALAAGCCPQGSLPALALMLALCLFS